MSFYKSILSKIINKIIRQENKNNNRINTKSKKYNCLYSYSSYDY